MVQIKEIREIQEIDYNILVQAVNFFNEHEIEYCLCAGTVLGAVRHNGFIPWDDDIDIYLPREDYDRFKEIVGKEGANCINNYLSVKIPGDESYPFPYIKIFDNRIIVKDGMMRDKFAMSVGIDVFPMDHYPDSEKEHRRYFRNQRLLRLILGSQNIKLLSPKFYLARILGFLPYHLMGGYRKITVLMDTYAKKSNQKNKDSRHYGCGTWPESEREYFETDMIFPFEMHVFENAQYYIPGGYDAYLKNLYGDYMTPPPEDKRARHDFEAYWI